MQQYYIIVISCDLSLQCLMINLICYIHEDNSYTNEKEYIPTHIAYDAQNANKDPQLSINIGLYSMYLNQATTFLIRHKAAWDMCFNQ